MAPSQISQIWEIGRFCRFRQLADIFFLGIKSQFVEYTAKNRPFRAHYALRGLLGGFRSLFSVFVRKKGRF